MELNGALSRRNFLTGLGMAGLGGAVLAACGGGSDGAGEGQDEDGELSALRVSSDLYASTSPQRFAFAIARGSAYASGPTAKILFKPPGGTAGPATDATLHAEGLPKGRGVYVVETALPTAGIWDATVEVDGEAAPLPFQVAALASAPTVGAAALRVPSPTTANPLNVDPLCTLDGGPCAMHAVSLDQVVGSGRPVIVSFSTPARCQTRYCGPTLEQVLEVRRTYESKIAFVHVEIYERPTGPTTVSTVKAWNLPTEPWLYAINGAGTIVGRLDGAFDRSEIKSLADRLVQA